MAILRTEKAMIRTMHGVILIDKISQKFMDLLGLEETLD